MAIKSLTKRAVDALRAAQSEYFVWDDALTGFGLKVAPTGRKTYVVQYRVRGEGRGGFARRLTLGQHGALTPDEARDLARKELGRVADGLNPVAVRKAKKAEREAARAAAVTVAELGKRYLADVQVRRKERTAKEYA